MLLFYWEQEKLPGPAGAAESCQHRQGTDRIRPSSDRSVCTPQRRRRDGERLVVPHARVILLPSPSSIPAVPDSRLQLDEINGHSQLEWGTDTSTCPTPREFGVRNVRGVSKNSFLQSAFSISVVFAVGK